MKYIKSISEIILLSTCANPAPAETPCDYDSSISTQYTKTIQKTTDYKKRVFPYVEDTRKCVINMNVTIDGKTYPTMGDFVFGPDISENSACKNAENRAKEMIVRKVSHEVLSANTDMKCTVKTEEIVENKVESIKKTIIAPQLGTVIESEIISVVKMKPPVVSTSQYRDSVLGTNRTIQLKASHEQGLITAIALELIRWIH